MYHVSENQPFIQYQPQPAKQSQPMYFHDETEEPKKTCCTPLCKIIAGISAGAALITIIVVTVVVVVSKQDDSSDSRDGGPGRDGGSGFMPPGSSEGETPTGKGAEIGCTKSGLFDAAKVNRLDSLAIAQFIGTTCSSDESLNLIEELNSTCSPSQHCGGEVMGHIYGNLAFEPSLKDVRRKVSRALSSRKMSAEKVFKLLCPPTLKTKGTGGCIGIGESNLSLYAYRNIMLDQEAIPTDGIPDFLDAMTPPGGVEMDRGFKFMGEVIGEIIGEANFSKDAAVEHEAKRVFKKCENWFTTRVVPKTQTVWQVDEHWAQFAEGLRWARSQGEYSTAWILDQVKEHRPSNKGSAGKPSGGSEKPSGGSEKPPTDGSGKAKPNINGNVEKAIKEKKLSPENAAWVRAACARIDYARPEVLKNSGFVSTAVYEDFKKEFDPKKYPNKSDKRNSADIVNDYLEDVGWACVHVDES